MLYFFQREIVLTQDTLVWDPPGNVKNIENYRVYYGKSSRNYPESEEASNQTSILLDFLPVNNTHYLVVVAYDSKGNESTYSNEVVYTNYLSGNPPPIAVDDWITTTMDIQSDINVIANDRSLNGTVVPSKVSLVRFSSHGTTTNNWDGTLTYTPDLGYNGKDSFPYTVQDDFGETSNKATVTVTIG
ncbi:MAG: hypothetical protein D8M57_07485 [Candidatus Scalindua sp. AMX11]|nr:MAG: hypothetical protein DWQ00_05735 [Candidatus Scalindua sp.]TDE65551.1 MAG: hypothetical protein D8M57_07485 [Candidatus Scalindua sp. AMX11]GJQ58134.1 MAG: hypothetical protein SCALA701_09350 [Candidatus Scalindua sp.]